MTSVLEQGIDIIVFPEGTFDEFDSDLKPFFDGAFRLALHAKKPLLPILFVDARERLHPSSIFSFTPGACRIVYLPPIETRFKYSIIQFFCAYVSGLVYLFMKF